MKSARLRDAVKALLGSALSAQFFESTAVKKLQHPQFVRADLRIDTFIRSWKPKEALQRSRVDGNVIWQYWDNGWRNAPEIARFCSEISEETLTDFKFQRLSASDVYDMGIVSEPLWNLLSKGSIGKAGFSDVLRFRLVEQFGGYWLDSTAMAVAEWDFTSSEILSYRRSGSVPGCTAATAPA